MAILQIHIYICLPDRNYVQEDSCLPDQASEHEDLADTVPLAHDDLGCPIRRDRLYQDNMGAKAKPLSGPPVSPSLFRSPRSSGPERPSPKAIQASIKESATLAAAISMQWKEEVSAMRRELADLRRDLCKELRAFNSNFNTFTQHYNTWSPQGGNMAAGGDIGLGRGAGTGSRSGTGVGVGVGAGVGVGVGVGGLGSATTERGTGGAREKKPQVSKVSVGTQARSKVLVRQSTADAAVNCPEEKEEMKGARRSLPKQLSMDPSILACPQSMYVESAIPLSLDPILPSSVKTVEQETFHLTAVPSTTEPDPEPELPDHAVVSSADVVVIESVSTPGTVPVSSEVALANPQGSVTVEKEMLINPQLIHVDPANESHVDTEPFHPVDMKSPDSELIERDKIQLPYPVPVVTVSPPEEHDYDVMSDSESPDPVTVDKPDPVSQDHNTVSLPYSLIDEPNPADPMEFEPKPSDLPMVPSSDPTGQGHVTVYDAPTLDLDTVTPCIVETDTGCPSIVVSEYLDTDSPASPADSDTNPEPIITLPEYLSDPFPEQITSVSTFGSTSGETQLITDPESQDSEWPPLPEPLDNTPIYHADLVHFDLVMLTSLDQDDLDSVFMDPEPEPFDLSVDSPSFAEDLDPPAYHSDCPSSPMSPMPTVDTVLCLLDPLQSAESVCLDPAVEYRLAQMPQDVTSELHKVPFPQITVTISPASSISPDTSLEMDFGPTSPVPDPLPPDTDGPSSPVPDPLPPDTDGPSSPVPDPLPPDTYGPSSPVPDPLPPDTDEPSSPGPDPLPPNTDEPSSPVPDPLPPDTDDSSSPVPDLFLHNTDAPLSPGPDRLPPETDGSSSPVLDPFPPDTDPSPPDPEDDPLVDLPHMEPDEMIVETLECMTISQEHGNLMEVETPGSLERSPSEQAFLWNRWQRRERRESLHRSASVELWSGRYEYNSAEITYVSLTL